MTPYIITFLSGVITSLIGALLYQKFQEYQINRPLYKLLNFGDDDIIFVFPSRPTTEMCGTCSVVHESNQNVNTDMNQDNASIIPKQILLWISTEDFLAINSFTRLLEKLNFKGEIKFRYANKFNDEDEKSKNIISICSPRRNVFTREILNEIRDRGSFFFDEDKESEKYNIKNNRNVGVSYNSPSYEQIEQFVKDKSDISAQKIDDFAIVSKLDNPKNPKNKILILAGIRGIGSWGVAEMFKKDWKVIYERVGKKIDSFSAVVAVKYKNSRIDSTEIRDVQSIDTRSI